MEMARKNFKNALFWKQNKQKFGFIPVNGLPNRVVDKNSNIPMSSMEAMKILNNDTLPNFCGKQIPIISKLKYDVWSKYLENYWDHQLPLLIKYGFPLDLAEKPILHSKAENHKSATDFAAHVDSYIEEELSHGAMAGPFKRPPAHLHTSPLMTREKS